MADRTVGDIFWVYQTEPGRQSKAWVEHTIIGETSRSWEAGPGGSRHRSWKIPKNGHDTNIVWTSEELAKRKSEDAIRAWSNQNDYKILEAIRHRLRANALAYQELRELCVLANYSVEELDELIVNYDKHHT